jgi:hypothetical protein
MLKKAKIRLPTRAAHCRECVFAGVYRAATVGESVPNDFFSSPLGELPARSKSRPIRSHDSLMPECHLSPFGPSGPCSSSDTPRVGFVFMPPEASRKPPPALAARTRLTPSYHLFPAWFQSLPHSAHAAPRPACYARNARQSARFSSQKSNINKCWCSPNTKIPLMRLPPVPAQNNLSLKIELSPPAHPPSHLHCGAASHRASWRSDIHSSLLDNNALKFNNGNRLKQAGFLAERLREE